MKTYPMTSDNARRLFARLDTPAHHTNERKAREAGLEPCTACGRAVQDGWMVVIVNGDRDFLAADHHEDVRKDYTLVETEFGTDNLGCWVLGPECGNALPAVVRSKWTGWNN